MSLHSGDALSWTDQAAAGRTRDHRVFLVSGATEALPGRFANLAVDCVESGETARCNGLDVVEDLLACDVRLVAGPERNCADRRRSASPQRRFPAPYSPTAHSPVPPAQSGI
jgi:ATP phosphoribosyltransferase